MHPYLKHLLRDIQNAYRDLDNQSQSEEESLEETFRDLENWISGTTEQSISYYTGLNKEDFPPSEQLSEPDMLKILHAFSDMMSSWNVAIDYPAAMPTIERYNFLIHTVIDDHTPLMNHGTIHLDYCSGNTEGCDWGQYCTCLEYTEDD